MGENHDHSSHIEYHDTGYMVYADNFSGAYSRAKTKEEALGKLAGEVDQYLSWTFASSGSDDGVKIEFAQQERTGAVISDADTEIIFDGEKIPLTEGAYQQTIALIIKSARDFLELHNSIPDVNQTTLLPRKSFYGNILCTVYEMLVHTNEVTKAYVSGLADIENISDIYLNRKASFGQIEKTADYLDNPV